MNETDSLREIYLTVLAKESGRRVRMLIDPAQFLEELEGYITESNDGVLRNILGDEIHLKRMWGGILLLASQLREKKDPHWHHCEPIIRSFWNRVAPLIFREGDRLSELLRKQLHASIFGEEELK